MENKWKHKRIFNTTGFGASFDRGKSISSLHLTFASLVCK